MFESILSKDYGTILNTNTTNIARELEVQEVPIALQFAITWYGFASLFHYFFTHQTARIWGILEVDKNRTPRINIPNRPRIAPRPRPRPRHAPPNPIAFWLLERIGIMNFQMALMCYFVLHYQDDLDYRGAYAISCAAMSMDAAYAMLFRLNSFELQGTNSERVRRCLVLDLMMAAVPSLLLAMPSNRVSTYIYNYVLKSVFKWMVSRGVILEICISKYGLYLMGLPSDDQGWNVILLQVLAASSMQFATFGHLYYFREMEATRALSLAMMIQFAAIVYFFLKRSKNARSKRSNVTTRHDLSRMLVQKCKLLCVVALQGFVVMSLWMVKQ